MARKLDTKFPGLRTMMKSKGGTKRPYQVRTLSQYELIKVAFAFGKTLAPGSGPCQALLKASPTATTKRSQSLILPDVFPIEKFVSVIGKTL